MMLPGYWPLHNAHNEASDCYPHKGTLRRVDANGRTYALECACGLVRTPIDDDGRPIHGPAVHRCGICGAPSPGRLLCSGCYRAPDDEAG